MFFGILLVVGLVILAVLATRGTLGGVIGGQGERRPLEPRRRDAPDLARQILDERYARGEISTEEYHERLRVLGGRS